MPTCVCGKECGNEGALSSHQAHCKEYQAASGGGSEPQQAQSTQAAQQPQQAQQAQPVQNTPTPANQQQQGQQGGVPATQGQMNALEMGAQFGEALAKTGSDSPEERAQAQGQLFQAIGAGVAKLGQKKAQEKIEGISRSKERQGEELSPSEEYAVCGECDGQIVDLPPRGTEFRCPHCGTMLES